MAYDISIKIEPLGDGTSVYVACHPELPGCLGQGVTPEEAISDLSEARALYLDVLRESGLPIPQESEISSISINFKPPVLNSYQPTPKDRLTGDYLKGSPSVIKYNMSVEV